MGIISSSLSVWSSFCPNMNAVVCPSAESLMLGTEIDLQRVDNSVFAMETVLKAWLQEQGGDREHLHLLLPSPLDNPVPGLILHTHTYVHQLPKKY